MNTEPLKKAIDYCEGITALAVKINEKPNTVSMWIQRDNLPADKVIPVSEATGWQVTPNQLRPDLYPHPHDGLPENMRQVA